MREEVKLASRILFRLRPTRSSFVLGKDLNCSVIDALGKRKSSPAEFSPR